jgi:hypothetical protein
MGHFAHDQTPRPAEAGLRRIGRGRLEVPGGVPTVSQVNDWGQATRLRTELDDAPSSLDKRLTPTAPPSGTAVRPHTQGDPLEGTPNGCDRRTP